ncbi:unnamed protein product [Cylindrotheca closterium]|uniref:N-acetyltransferase domain-containing protein n=1 Tax=Cylindrotheca closterium TaxID=2856 RepID=A0AAD2FFX9_9STRA|nr:unnamed protein product [Cylindrotheca closterium]
MLMLMSMVRSTAAWSSASHFTSLESSTPDWNHQNDAGPTSIHAWWNKSTVSSSSTASEPEDDDESAPSSFFIRPALPADVGPASKILADGFFKDNTNFITYQFERLETWLSLDIGFPRPNTRHELFVACEQSTGKVLGLAEVDARIERPTVCNGPYLCNVAVDLDHLRQGIATALVEKCEAQVQEWVYESVQKEAATLNEKDSKDTSTATTSRLSSSLHLKVRQNNAKAVTMYDKLGYQSILQELDKKNQTVLVMRKQLERLNNNINNNNEEAEATKGVSTTR